ncbi:DEAD/DEAH box helicase [Pseudobutyrivibrio ruminis]|uniref:DEAD/DEAH box helicase n=1 Tax=Pseudobutyrivibrio ruminis DSM 9787 TaxID=1123011 RepID=A0A285REP8_9FIRM|nr:DEAD/DEAH box helicase [Pseudobutyrivibrio ruminis]SOB92576.1 DEAD/DEAH box helicase [Pseudobutyrivibrio ruminis DSM 9787]
MKKEYKDLLNYWLEIDFVYIANKAGFLSKRLEVDEVYVNKTIHILDKMTRDENIDKNIVITILALLWEHADKERYDIRQVALLFLSRIGYPTSAIICDEGFDKKNCLFSPVHSLIQELSIMAHQEKNEVKICNKNFLLTDYQKKIWDAFDSDKKIVGISAPTSAGKSFVIALKIMYELSRKNMDVVYIVPTLSLINQVTEDFNSLRKEFGIENCLISSTYQSNQSDFNYIYVLTQEKAIASFDLNENAFNKNLVFVVDEVQNIERMQDENDERAKVLFDALLEFSYKENVLKVIVSGPRIENIDSFASDFFKDEAVDCSTNISPVLNITYSIAKYGRDYYFKQYCALTAKANQCKIEDSSMIIGYGKSKYDESYLEYLGLIVNKLGSNNQNLIFAPTVATARNIALSLKGKKNGEVQALVDYYKETVRDNYALSQALNNGVAYNHARLPMHVRRTVEKAISNKVVSNVVCTTTLLQGVNLPAQNIFIRNPHLYEKKSGQTPELTNYEMANLRGRAGRLLKDFVGRTFVLDENSFGETEGYEQEELFDNPEKELPTGFEVQYENYSAEIATALDNKMVVNDEMQGYGHLVSYIRQTVMRYDSGAKARLDNVGIHLTKEQVAAIILKMNELEVPREICSKNRYWDPMILNEIYTSDICDVPNSPIDRKAKDKLANVLKELRNNPCTSYMYNKYIPREYRNGRMRHIMCDDAIKWAKGIKLCDLLKGSYYDGPDGMDHIDNTIDMLERTVSYKLPLLLKPIYDMKLPESTFLSTLQVGANIPGIRHMIEIGIPRETAIYLYEKCFASEEGWEDEVEEKKIRQLIKDKFNELPYWIQVQLNYLI